MDVAVVQVRAVSVFLSFDGRGNSTHVVPGRVHTKDEKLVNQENSGRMADIAGTGADMDIPNGVIGRGAWRASIRTAVLRSLLISRFHAFCAPSPDAAGRPTELTRRQPS